MEKIITFDKERTLFIDDTAEILSTARTYGIAHLLLKARANSKKEETPAGEFPELRDFAELLPLLETADVRAESG